MIPNDCDTEATKTPSLYDIPVSGPIAFSLSENEGRAVIFVNPEEEGSGGGVTVELVHVVDSGRSWFEQRISGSLAESIHRPGVPVVAGRLTRRRSRSDLEMPWLLAPLTPDEMASAREWAAEHLVRLADGTVECDYGTFAAS